ncbi:glycosyltransferase family 8 protein [Paenibacillus endoradicis]|uniref:glycosyltransferase family 8 protein n=1 Tax=Paenibacillus endoradicis TaxID=2972487 RepID=UPI002159423F|nr:glycosyltransferase family 8 protein [Paenibacillus endoradicis]MCR8660518.1 glycosyltransferase family 8 protein [Paenibacillus endoradicis]
MFGNIKKIMDVSEVEKFHVIFSSDDNYIQHLIATLVSMLENTNYAQHIIVNVIDGGISEENKQYLNVLVNKYNSSIKFLDIDTSMLENVVVNGHISEATYYRILIPTLFENSISKVIYLDCDLIVRHDIYEFYNIDISNYALGAIKVNEYNRHEQLGIPKDSKYFNAGVLIINLTKWRINNISTLVMKFIATYPERLKMWDQDALNAILYNDWYEIDYIWNLRAQLFNQDFQTAGFDSEAVFENAKNDPAISHFTTASKPWHFLNNHPYKEEYFKYLDVSKYPYVKFPEKGFILTKKIIVFGTGKSGEQVTQRLLEQGIEVAHFVDNNQEKWGREFIGKKIYDPGTLLEENSKFIIIASQYNNEIAEQLINMGLRAGQHFLKDLNWNTNIITE